MRLPLTLIYALCLLSCFAAQDGFQSRRYSAADGLPNHTVRDILQDSHGFVWIATLNGLSRFDGSRFETFRSEPGNPLSLSDNRVHSLTEDQDAFLWIETTSRIFSCFDLRKGRFVDYADGQPSPYNALYMASGGDVWLSNSDGGALRVRHLPDRELRSERFDAASRRLPADRVNAVFETKDGDILLGTSEGFSRVSGDKVRVSSVKTDVFSFFESKGLTYAVGSDGGVFRLNDMELVPVASLPEKERVSGVVLEEGSVAVLTDYGSWQVDLKSGKALPHPVLDVKGGQVLVDNVGRQWIYSHTGRITFLSRKDRSYRTLNLIPSDIMGRTDHERYRVIEDPEGTIWISTYGNGLFAYREDDGSLRNFTSGGEGLIASSSLRGMMLDGTGTLWLGTGQSGISTLWRDTRDIRRFLPDSHNPADRRNSIRVLHPWRDGWILFSSKDGGLYGWMPGDSASRSVRDFNANLYSLLDDGKGETLYGTRGEGLFVGSRHYRHIPDDSSSLPDDNIYFIRRDRKGRVWIGTFGGGLALMEPDPAKEVSFRTFFGDVHGRAEQRHMIEDLDGRFWIGTSEGLLTFHPDSLLMGSAISGHTAKVYSKSNGVLNCNEARFLMRDSKGELWIATGNDGVIRATTDSDGALKVVRQYTVADGLSNNSIQSIVEDDGGFIWIATEYGLSRMDPKGETFDSYIFSEVPQENVYAEGSVLKQADGVLLFGTGRGIVSIDPRKFNSTEGSVLALRFTGLSINGTPYAPGQEESPMNETLDYTDRMVLAPYQNSFAVDFTVMDFRDNGRFRYSYMLEGYDKEWSAPSPEGTATFSYVPSGSYTLRVRCLDGGRVVAEGELRIQVRAPWWRTPWAIAAYAVLAVTVIWLIVRRKVSHGSDENVGRHGSCVREPSDTEDADIPKVASTLRVRPEPSDTEDADIPKVASTLRVRPEPTEGNFFEDSAPSDSSDSSDPFLEKLESIARENLSNPAFSVDDFASAMNLGRAVFYRKLKEVADTTPNEYIKRMRMQEAARLLQTAPELNIAEISDRVGFSDSLYFSKCFKAEFGQSPTSYRKEH